MKNLLVVLLLALSGYASAATLTISCQNALATKEDGSTYVVKEASVKLNGEESVLLLDGTQNTLPPVATAYGAYVTRLTYSEGMTMTVTATEGMAPHSAALFVSVEDKDGNATWSLMGAACKSRKTK